MNSQNKIFGRIFAADTWKSWSTHSLDVDPLPGEYSVHFFDTNDHLIGVARDILGLQPVYYTLNGELKVFSTLREAAQSVSSLSINWDYLYSIMADNFTLLDQSPFKEVRRLPPGHLLFKENNKWLTRPYFLKIKPQDPIHFRDVFLDVMNDRATRHSNFVLSFSGGFDSSLILASLLKQNIKAKAVTLLFPHEESSEKAALDSFEKKWGVCFEKIEVPEIKSGIYDWRANDCFYYIPTETMFNPLLEYAQKNKIQDVWFGFGADEVFTLNSCLLSTLLLSGEWASFKNAFIQTSKDSSLPSAIYAIFRDLAPKSLKMTLALVVKNTSRLPFEQVLHYKKIARLNRLQRMSDNPIQNEIEERLYHSGSIAFIAEQSYELASLYGLHFSYPYLDIRLIAMALNMRPQDFYNFKQHKFLLRTQFKDVLPSEIVQNSSRQTYNKWLLEAWVKQDEIFKSLLPSEYRPVYHEGANLNSVYDNAKLVYLAQFLNRK